MPLKKSAGNMYPWLSHMHTHLAGECPHACSYCYVQSMEHRFQGGRYTGPLRLEEQELHVDYGQDRTIFVEHMNDLFAAEVPDAWIFDILAHCRRFPRNQYVLQTKNSDRVCAFEFYLPHSYMLGTTLETNRDVPGRAPSPAQRMWGMFRFKQQCRVNPVTFVTIEPILDFDVNIMLTYLMDIHPDFVNIGADSKGHGLVEPSGNKVRELINGIQQLGFEIRQKTNLARLLEPTE